MNWKTLAATTALAAVLGIGVLAGSLLSPSAKASVPVTQTSRAGQAAQTTPTPAPDTQKPALPGDGSQWQGQRGEHGGFGGPGAFGGPGGFSGDRGEGHGPRFDGGPGGGHFGGGYTADGATRAISSTTGVIALVKGDLTYATGKMDTATVQSWVNNADNLLTAAETANVGGEYGKAVETANAARALVGTAQLVMWQALGADTLPSYIQRQQGMGPGRGMHPGVGAQTTLTVTQVQASRVLLSLHNNITSQEALVNNSTTKSDASTYLAAAQDQYSKAYTAYQSGNYTEATGAAKVGQSLLRVVNLLLDAGTAPNGPDVPVQVPAPFV